MHILIAPQALKGSLTAAETTRAIAEGVRAATPNAMVTELPIADGGEGTVEAMVAATGGKIIPVTVTGPLGESVSTFFGILDERGSMQGTAVIEMAAASGLSLVPPERRNPRITTTSGVDQDEQALYNLGITAIVPLPTAPMTLAEAMSSAHSLVSRAAERTLRLIGIGNKLAFKQ